MQSLYILRFYKRYSVFSRISVLISTALFCAGYLLYNCIVDISGTYRLSVFKNYGFDRSLLYVIMIFFLLMIMLFMVVYLVQNGELMDITVKMTEDGSADHQKRETFVKELQPLYGELIMLKSSYETALNEKIKSENFKTELITNVSHDIKTPLTSIINYIGLLKILPINDDSFAGYIEILDKKSMRLKILIEDLLEASKAGTGNIAVNNEPIDLVELVGQLMGELDDKTNEKNFRFISNHPDEPVIINADGRHLWRVLDNLFQNAIKYSMPNTRIYSDITVNQIDVVFSLKNISNAPLNVPADELLGQFVRGDRSRGSEGSGLGLYIAKTLTELIGGRMALNINGDLFEVALILNQVQRDIIPHS